MILKSDRVQDYYKTGFQYLQDELKRIDLLIHQQVLRIRQQRRDSVPEGHLGLFILDEEIDALLRNDAVQLDEEVGCLAPSTPEIESLGTYLQHLNLRIAEKASTSLNMGVSLPLFQLMNVMQLTPFEIDSILILLGAELDTKYEKLYAYLQNDITQKRPTISLILSLLCGSPEEKAMARAVFASDGPLLRNHLIEFSGETPNKHVPLNSQALKLDERMTSFLLGFKTIDERIMPCVKIIEPRLGLEDVIIPMELKEKVTNLSTHINDDLRSSLGPTMQNRFVLYFKGAPNNSQRQVAEAICHAAGLSLLELDLEAIPGTSIPLSLVLHLVFREARLQRSAVYIKGVDRYLDEGAGNVTGLRSILMDTLEEYAGLVFLESQKDTEFGPNGFSAGFYILDFPVPAYATRKDLWKYHLDSHQLGNSFDYADLADKFQLTDGQIKNAIATAINLAAMKNGDKASITLEDILDGCRAASNQKLITLSRKIQSRYGWKDIILPSDRLAQLQEVCNYIKYRHIVYDDWGFDAKLSRGKGLNILFHGPSGTGKTMAAEVIAGELGLELYKIDLSFVVSKYIGETEKNLNRIFSEAQTSNCILFFDEADALFGKRSEVRDAHDRYANIEVAYLLQKMEEYEGMVILATNLVKDMDEAFTRRMHFSVEFPFPDEENRLKIWKSILPRATPRVDDIAFEFLARKFHITGGNIKNIALAAAFLAAAGSGKIDMKCIIRAVKREFQKMGVLNIPSDFGKYYDLTLES